MNTPVSPDATTHAVVSPSFVEWSAVLAGGVFAAAISFILLAFGTAVGFSLVSPWTSTAATTKTVASMGVVWTVAQQIGALLAGGYIAGRLRSRWSNTTTHEVEFRDGVHGGLVWAVSVIIGAMLAIMIAQSALRVGSEAVGRTATAAATTASSMNDPLTAGLDTLLRTSGAVNQPNAPANASANAADAAKAPLSADVRTEIGRIFTRSAATGNLSQEDRNYVSAIVAQRAGIPQQEAEQRVTAAYTQITSAVKSAADTARKSAALAGFVTAASLILSLGAAWWAAVRGGNHRDNSIPARFSFAVRQA